MPEPRLTPGQAALGLRLLGWRLALPLLRRALPVERLVRLTAAPRSRSRDPERERLLVRAAGRLWRAADAPCLERSLALHRQLGLAGAAPALVLGMARDASGIVGHAWVEVDGAALLEPVAGVAYATVVRFDAAGTRSG